MISPSSRHHFVAIFTGLLSPLKGDAFDMTNPTIRRQCHPMSCKLTRKLPHGVYLLSPELATAFRNSSLYPGKVRKNRFQKLIRRMIPLSCGSIVGNVLPKTTKTLSHGMILPAGSAGSPGNGFLKVGIPSSFTAWTAPHSQRWRRDARYRAPGWLE